MQISENYPEVFHACLNVTGNEKNISLLYKLHLAESRVLFCLSCFITRVQERF